MKIGNPNTPIILIRGIVSSIYVGHEKFVRVEKGVEMKLTVFGSFLDLGQHLLPHLLLSLSFGPRYYSRRELH